MKTSKMTPLSTTSLSSAWGLVPLPSERQAGRFLRAPEGHGDAGGGAGDAGGGGDAGAGDAGAAGGEAGKAAGEGEGDQGSGDQVTSLAGDAGEGGKPKAEGEAGDAGAEGEGEGKDGEPKFETIGAPEAYDLKAPEGMEFDTEAFAKVEPILRKLDLSGPAAQELVNAYAGEVIPLLQERAATAAQARTEEANVAYRKQLADEARADPEIGGAKFNETIDLVASTWERFGIKKGEGFRQLLDDSGLGNHPDMLRFLARVGKATGEGSFVPSDAAAATKRKSDAEVFYPDQARSQGG